MNMFFKITRRVPDPKPLADPNHPFMKKTFKDAFLSKEVCESVIMDYKLFWEKLETGKTIQEFLGMSENQYIDWLTNAPVGMREMLLTDY